jgi:hypothetical protein
MAEHCDDGKEPYGRALQQASSSPPVPQILARINYLFFDSTVKAKERKLVIENMCATTFEQLITVIVNAIAFPLDDKESRPALESKKRNVFRKLCSRRAAKLADRRQLLIKHRALVTAILRPYCAQDGGSDGKIGRTP